MQPFSPSTRERILSFSNHSQISARPASRRNTPSQRRIFIVDSVLRVFGHSVVADDIWSFVRLLFSAKTCLVCCLQEKFSHFDNKNGQKM